LLLTKVALVLFLYLLDEDMNLTYRPINGTVREAQLTDFAFSLLTQRIGIPSAYIIKCIDAGKIQLALNNYKSWASDFDRGVLVRESKGVVQAVLSDSYTPYDSNQIINNLQYTCRVKYELSAVYLSEDRLYLRFVDYNRLSIHDKGGSDIYAGFTVDSSDVGCGALCVCFFLYRFDCCNGVFMSGAAVYYTGRIILAVL